MQKQYRLAKNEEFTKVYRRGKSFANHQFALYYMPSPLPHIRLGVSASKKIGNAVVRNRMRRLVKEIVRLHMSSITMPYDLIVIVRKPAVSMEYQELEKSMLHVLKRASLIKK